MPTVNTSSINKSTIYDIVILFDLYLDTDSFRVIDSVQKLKEKTETKMDFIVSLADKAMDLSHEEVVSFLAWGMIGNGLFVAPILTFILPAYYGQGFEKRR